MGWVRGAGGCQELGRWILWYAKVWYGRELYSILWYSRSQEPGQSAKFGCRRWWRGGDAVGGGERCRRWVEGRDAGMHRRVTRVPAGVPTHPGQMSNIALIDFHLALIGRAASPLPVSSCLDL